jgi:hypothetical protein
LSKRQGAIVGSQLGGIVKNCYSVSTMTGYNQPGQIVGLQKDDATIENCYAAGVVTGTTKVGSFAGQLANVTTSSYWDKDLQAEGVGDGGTDVVGLTTAEFGTQANFVGWDFENTWKMGTVNEVARPVLQWQDLVGAATSAKEISSKTLVKVYPNPASSYLTIENAPLNAKYSLINLNGQIQKSGIITNERMILHVDDFNQGFYVLKVGNNYSKIIIK